MIYRLQLACIIPPGYVIKLMSVRMIGRWEISWHISTYQHTLALIVGNNSPAFIILFCKIPSASELNHLHGVLAIVAVAILGVWWR